MDKGHPGTLELGLKGLPTLWSFQGSDHLAHQAIENPKNGIQVHCFLSASTERC